MELALPLLGAAVAPSLGFAATTGWLVGSVLYGLTAGRTRKGRPTIHESGAQTVQEGAPLSIVYGTAPVTGNVIASGPVRKVETPIKQGKGGSKTVGTEVAYYCTYAIAIGEPIGGILMVKQDGAIVFDARDGANFDADNAKFLARCTIYLGDEEQLPDPNLEAIFGAGEVEAYRGTSYIVFKDDDLTARGGSVSQYEFLCTSTPVYTPPDEVFEYTGEEVEYVVPEGVTTIRVKAWAGGGCGGRFRNAVGYAFQSVGGGGGYVDGLIDVTPGQVLRVIVGGGAIHGVDAPRGPFIYEQSVGFAGWAGATAQFQGGVGAGRNDSPAGGCGGGASAVANSSGTPLILAGAGAGGGAYGDVTPDDISQIDGAPGGGIEAEYTNKTGNADGFAWGGGGTQERGGYAGNDPALQGGANIGSPPGQGGNADVGDPPTRKFAGGGGGGGVHGGGGGSGSNDGDVGGGGGGSSLIPEGGVQEPGSGANPGGMDQPEWSGYGIGADGQTDAGNGAVFFFLNYSNTAGTDQLDGIIQDIHSRCDTDAPDTSDLAGITVKGLPLSSTDYTGAGAIDMLRSIYLFDRFEIDGQIVYRKRGQAAVATITEDDLVDVEDEGDRDAQAEYPRKLLFTALNPTSNYEASTVASSRYSPDVRVNGEASISVPVVMDEEEMATRAAIMHKVAWAEAEGEVKFSLPYKWIWLTPGDCLLRAMGGQTRRIRIEEISDADFVRSITGKFDRANSYVANPTFVPLPSPNPPVSRVVGDTVLAVMDLPALAEVDDALVQYVAVSADGPGWTGAVVQRSLDEGETFGDVITLGAAVLGELLDPVTSAPEFFTDTTNVVRVQLTRDGQELISISDTAFLSGGGAFALEKADGTFEVMQYLDAEDEGEGVFALTTLHRGVLNSKSAAHAVGAKFVLLSGATSIPMESALISRELVHRAPSIGQVAEEADQQTQTFAGRAQLEWSVDHFSVERDGGDVITGSWVPRHRFGSELAPVASVNFQGYRVTLDDGTDTVVIDTTSTNFTHDASAMDTPVTVTVAALNRITGPGEAVSEDI